MLALKLFLVPSLIAVITLIGRRWGPLVAGCLSGFPVVAGPILLLVYMEYGAVFAAGAASAALNAVPGNVCFGLGYAWAATRFPWWISLPVALILYVLTQLGLSTFSLPLPLILLLTLSSIWFGSRAFPKNIEVSPPKPPPAAELPARMIAGGILVLLVTVYASSLGPKMSGMFAMFPVMAAVLACFSHPASGAGFVIRLLQGMIANFYSLAFFCFTVAAALPVMGATRGFLLATACAMLAQAGSLWFSLSRRGRATHK
ncbi:MAG: hypothetical protein V4632_07710 [Pseudomonadota bacterium]